ncbi:MAG: porin [Betaproteobacteria bacterium]
MNKKLLALAVAGACVAPAAMAQTANPVTLYGRVYLTFESVEAKGGPSNATPVPRRQRVTDQSSLLGVRGTEDLGGGLKAFFQLETRFRADQNNTTFADRNSGVGLQGGFGSFMLGRWDMPWKVATIAVDPYGDLTLGGITGTLSDGGNFDRRDQNVVQYWSPTIAGFAARLAVTANENKTTSANPRDYGANVTYTGGPLYAFLAYEKHKDQLNGNGVGTPVAGVTSGTDEKGWAAGASFVFGPIKLGGQYQRIEKSSRSDQKNWMANVVWTLGNNQFIYQYMQSKDGGLNSASEQPDCRSHGPGYQYNFTKRTFLLAQYVKVDNKNNASTCNFGADRLAISGGQDPQGVAVGIRHVF